MDLTKEAIDKIEELAVKASGADAHTFTFEKGRVRVVNAKTGVVGHLEVPSFPPVMTVRGLGDLTAAINDYGDIDSDATCFIDESSVVVFFDESRNSYATLPLKMNPAIDTLKRMKDLPPAQLRRLLRVELFDVETSPEDFCDVISVLKFEAMQTTDVALRKGDESIGKSVRSKVTAESDIPEQVTFTLPVYPELAGVNTIAQIRCAVVTDPSAGTLSVMPYPGQIDAAVTLAVHAIQEALRDSVHDLRVYCGRMVS